MNFTGSPGISRKRKKLVTRTASSETAAPPSLPATYLGYPERTRPPGAPAAGGPSGASTSAGVASAVIGHPLSTVIGYPRFAVVVRALRARLSDAWSFTGVGGCPAPQHDEDRRADEDDDTGDDADDGSSGEPAARGPVGGVRRDGRPPAPV